MWCDDCKAYREQLRDALFEARLAEAVRIAAVGARKLMGDALGLDGHNNGTTGDLRETLPIGVQGGGSRCSEGGDGPDG